MPTYKAKCDVCEIEEEYTAPMCHTDEEVPPCPKCQEIMVKTWIDPEGGFVLKGTGWFKDGY